MKLKKLMTVSATVLTVFALGLEASARNKTVTQNQKSVTIEAKKRSRGKIAKLQIDGKETNLSAEGKEAVESAFEVLKNNFGEKTKEANRLHKLKEGEIEAFLGDAVFLLDTLPKATKTRNEDGRKVPDFSDGKTAVETQMQVMTRHNIEHVVEAISKVTPESLKEAGLTTAEAQKLIDAAVIYMNVISSGAFFNSRSNFKGEVTNVNAETGVEVTRVSSREASALLAQIAWTLKGKMGGEKSVVIATADAAIKHFEQNLDRSPELFFETIVKEGAKTEQALAYYDAIAKGCP